MSDKIRISTSKNGPLVVENLKNLTNAAGNTFLLKNVINALCRCGNSKNKILKNILRNLLL